jgi:hypothetical protein
MTLLKQWTAVRQMTFAYLVPHFFLQSYNEINKVLSRKFCIPVEICLPSTRKLILKCAL